MAGIGVSAAHATPLAILPDVIDWDELRRAQRQEAAYYSVITLIQKLVGAVTITLTGTLLSASGYVANANLVDGLQPATALGTIRFLAVRSRRLLRGRYHPGLSTPSTRRDTRILSLLAKRRAQSGPPAWCEDISTGTNLHRTLLSRIIALLISANKLEKEMIACSKSYWVLTWAR
ncbi:MFS transporter [Candidatus Amarolinea dominans]|uniref:MFS transporter n=1 Tax=Candidatus Amarolinea dominans TaxID=3140696 RepID=UPI001D50C2A4|nr:MFS transporter [Anaerolineae bacterium]